MREELMFGVLQGEFERVAARSRAMDAFNGKTVLITGATGLIGAQLVKTILCHNRLYGGSARVIACGRNVRKMDALYGHLRDVSALKTVIADVTQPLDIQQPVDAIIHLASVTSSKEFVDKPVDTIRTLISGTDHMLAFAREKAVSKFVYVSSLEVYGVPAKFEVSEGDYGYIDFLSPRSSYSEGKRMAECLCKAYKAQYGVPVCIARLTQTIGAGVDYGDMRVFAQFARCVVEHTDIVLNTPGRTVRSYLDVCDAAEALFTLLARGEAGEAYNVANMDTAISIVDFARLMLTLFPESGAQLRFNEAADARALGYNPEMRISLDTHKLSALGWHAQIPLEETLSRLVEGLNEKRARFA